MPRLYRRKARTDRYKIGKKVETESIAQGFVRDYSKPNMNAFNEFELDELICKKGEFYYTWHPKGSPWQFSKTKPDLRPEWERTIEEFRHRVCDCIEGESDERDELLSEIEEMRDELQSRLDNIPEQLQESSVLNERIEELDGLIFDIEEMD